MLLPVVILFIIIITKTNTKLGQQGKHKPLGYPLVGMITNPSSGFERLWAHLSLALSESEGENQRLLEVRITLALDEMTRRHYMFILENVELQAKVSEEKSSVILSETATVIFWFLSFQCFFYASCTYIFNKTEYIYLIIYF